MSLKNRVGNFLILFGLIALLIFAATAITPPGNFDVWTFLAGAAMVGLGVRFRLDKKGRPLVAPPPSPPAMPRPAAPSGAKGGAKGKGKGPAKGGPPPGPPSGPPPKPAKRGPLAGLLKGPKPAPKPGPPPPGGGKPRK